MILDTTKQTEFTTSIPAYIRQRELLASYVPFSASTLWRKVSDGSFVRPVKLSSRITAWKRSEVIAWLAEKGGEA